MQTRRFLRSLQDYLRVWQSALSQGQPIAILGLVLVVGLVFSTMQIFLKDDKVGVGHLIPAGSMCANQEDMYDAEARRCQMGNKYAYAYLLRHSWVMCAPNMPGAKILRKSEDSFSNFWYHPKDREAVREFYRTCVPTCADDADTYQSSLDMCLMSNDIARVWLQGDGQHCDSNTPGAGAIKRASKRVGDGNFWYKPEMASRVREFYKSCSARCAKGDSTLDSMYCQVRNPMALSFLQQGGSQVVCDDISPGRSAVSRCPDGMYNGLCDGSVYRYRRRRGEEVEAWYTSCMQQPSGGGRQGQRVSRRNRVPPTNL